MLTLFDQQYSNKKVLYIIGKKWNNSCISAYIYIYFLNQFNVSYFIKLLIVFSLSLSLSRSLSRSLSLYIQISILYYYFLLFFATIFS